MILGLPVEAVGFGVFAFVVVLVGGWRWINAVEARRVREATERREAVERRARQRDYVGPYVNRWGREV